MSPHNLPLQQTGRPRRAPLLNVRVGGRLLSGRVVRATAGSRPWRWNLPIHDSTRFFANISTSSTSRLAPTWAPSPDSPGTTLACRVKFTGSAGPQACAV